MGQVKKIQRVYEHGSAHWVGDGFPVRNLIPSSGLEKEIDPFLLLDYAGPSPFEASSRPRGVGEHPHRGFETVTIAYQGSVDHRDSAGNAGTINPGDIQWMTAGSGVVHEEMHETLFAAQGGTFEMIQLWVNLPKEHKMTAPRYQTLKDGDIPRIAIGDQGYVRVIAGEIDGVRGPARTFTEITLLDVEMKFAQELSLSLSKEHNTAAFLLKGRIRIDGEAVSGDAKLILLDTTGDIMRVAADSDSHLLVLSGKPIAEPIASYGPFVMNTQEELMQAVDDYRAGRMGRLAGRL